MNDKVKEKQDLASSEKPKERYKVRFLPHQKETIVYQGTNLLDAAIEAGVYINASCGGKGVCGGCKVRIDSGSVSYKHSPRLSIDEERAGIRQACLCAVESDVIVFIPRKSRADAGALPEEEGISAAKSADLAPDLQPVWTLNPPNKRLFIQADPPRPGDNMNDYARILLALKKQAINDVTADFRVLKHLPREARKHEWQLTLTTSNLRRDAHGLADTKEHRRPRLIHVEGGNSVSKNFGIAVDIGTTTIAAELLDVHSGRVLSRRSEYNAQISRGDDVISRIMYAEKENGLEELQWLVVGTINELISRLLEDTKIDKTHIFGMTVAGNTAMTHIFLGLDTRHIRRSPYTPVMFMAPQVPAVALGIDLPDWVRVYTFPMVSSYVGGDIVSGIIATGMYLRPELTLYIDIGTNGEIVIGNNEWLLTASCSAGPAFEGGGIEYGMRATIGAIDSVTVNPETSEPTYETIGGRPPRGICGSGIMDLCAELLTAGLLGPDGKFDMSRNCPRLRKGKDTNEYVVEYALKNGIGEDIVFTEIDVDNLMRAKAAMYAGYNTLLESVGMDVSNVERILIAGGFGRGLKFENAITIGLLPDINRSRIRYIGNGSLIGSRLVCLSEELMNESERIGGMMTNFELSENTRFMDLYMAAMFMPHTDLNKFPSVHERMRSHGKVCRKAKEGGQMSFTVAVAGKGGTGKTTVASLMVRELIKQGKKPILAVDSDPDANFHTGLGLPVFKTVGQIQQDWVKTRGEIPLGISKQDYLISSLNAALSEGKNVDLLTMGRPQGPGCYCSANAVLRDFVAKLQPNYSAVVVDNEAGMEHISRRTVENLDALLMVADPTPVGVRTVGRLIELVKELDLNIPIVGLVLSRTDPELPKRVQEQIDDLKIDLLGMIPRDKLVDEFCIEERSLLELPDDSPAAMGAAKLFEKISAKSG